MNKLNLRISSILSSINEHTNNEFKIENNVLLFKYRRSYTILFLKK